MFPLQAMLPEGFPFSQVNLTTWSSTAIAFKQTMHVNDIGKIIDTMQAIRLNTTNKNKTNKQNMRLSVL